MDTRFENGEYVFDDRDFECIFSGDDDDYDCDDDDYDYSYDDDEIEWDLDYWDDCGDFDTVDDRDWDDD